MAYGNAVRSSVRACGLTMALSWSWSCGGAPAEPMNSTSGDPVEVPPWACVPGEAQPCPCPEELEGLRTCNPDGSGFGECDCSPGAVSQGPPPTSTGTESGPGTGTASGSGPDTGPGDTTTAGSTSSPDPSTSGPESTSGPDPTTGQSSSS